MTETVKTYFRDAEGNVSEALLPAIEATSAVRRYPHQWSYDRTKFAPVPKGAVPATGPAGGLGRLAGASVRAD